MQSTGVRARFHGSKRGQRQEALDSRRRLTQILHPRKTPPTFRSAGLVALHRVAQRRDALRSGETRSADEKRLAEVDAASRESYLIRHVDHRREP